MKVKNSRGGTKNGVRIVVSWNRFDAFVFSNSLNKITYLRFGVNGRTGGKTTRWMVLNDIHMLVYYLQIHYVNISTICFILHVSSIDALSACKLIEFTTEMLIHT